MGSFLGSRLYVQTWGEREKPRKSKGCISSWGQRGHGGTAQPPVSSQASLPPHCPLPTLSLSILTQPWLPSIGFTHFAA